MKLITWNVQGAGERGGKARQQVDFLAQYGADIIALQDVSFTAVPTFASILGQVGLSAQKHTLDGASSGEVSGVLVASRFPLIERLRPDLQEVIPEDVRTPHPDKIELHWRRRSLIVDVDTIEGVVNVINAYITPGTHKELDADGQRREYRYIKVDMLSAVFHTVASLRDCPLVLCGDFNSPREERSNGEIVPWGRKPRGHSEAPQQLREDQYVRELRIHGGMAQWGVRDAYRAVHGYANAGQDEALSYQKTTGERRPERRRYDHVFASKEIVPESARYLGEAVKQGLSDHAPLEVTFRLASTAAAHAAPN